jgi:hypothetical protein
MLHTLTYEFDLPQDRTLQLKLPDTIKIGKHHIVLIIDEQEENANDLNSIRNQIQQQGITEDIINEAINWAKA